MYIPEANTLFVQAGDHFGFTWLDLGVISYDRVATDNFCELHVSLLDVCQAASCVSQLFNLKIYPTV